MAARKKVAPKKKQTKSTSKKSPKKKQASKQSLVKKAVKKAFKKKSGLAKSKEGKRSESVAPDKGAEGGIIASTVKTRTKQRSGKLRIGAIVRTSKGRHAGEVGKVVAQDPYLGTYFLTFDRYKKDPVYKDIQWGPFFESTLESVS